MAEKTKIVRCRKDYVCAYCGEVIKKGDLSLYTSERTPRYDKDDIQVGIEFLSFRLHHDPLCEELQPKIGKVVQSKDGVHTGKIKHVYTSDFVDVVWGLNRSEDWMKYCASKELIEDLVVIPS